MRPADRHIEVVDCVGVRQSIAIIGEAGCYKEEGSLVIDVLGLKYGN